MRAPRPELARFGASTAALPNCREEARSSFWLLVWVVMRDGFVGGKKRS